jgi:tellurite resistance protein TehA-like permease
MLLVLGVWRHGIRRFPLRYDPLYWGAVFPLGMYPVCTQRLSQEVSAPYLASIASAFVFVALAAWVLATLGFARALLPTRPSGAPG